MAVIYASMNYLIGLCGLISASKRQNFHTDVSELPVETVSFFFADETAINGGFRDPDRFMYPAHTHCDV
jgi:hypothetical protein